MTSRRKFIQIVPVAGAAMLGVQAVSAQAVKLDEKDPQAVGLGYVHDATKADKAKYKNWTAGANCSNCQLYQGKAEPWGGCPLFGTKLVNAKGWCSAYAKKAG